MPNVDCDLHDASGPESSDPALQSARASGDNASVGVKAVALVCAHSHPLNVVAQGNERGQSVRQVEQRGGRDDGDEAKVVGNSRGDDEGNAPPDGHQRSVEELAGLGCKRRCLQDVHKNVVVEHLDTNVAVQTGGDQSGNQGQGVSNGLPGVGRDSLEAGVVAVLALELEQRVSSSIMESAFVVLTWYT